MFFEYIRSALLISSLLVGCSLFIIRIKSNVYANPKKTVVYPKKWEKWQKLEPAALLSITKQNATHLAETICKIPKPDPWDPTIREFFGTGGRNMTCKQIQRVCTTLDDDQWLKITCPDVSCKFQCFDRKPGADRLTNFFYGPWTQFQEQVQLGCEFSQVKCDLKSTGRNVYANFYSQIIPKPGILNPERKSVILLVLDSVSHSSFRRDLPLSHHVLKTEFGAKIMDGHVKTGSNSFPNAVTFLTGREQYDPELRYHKTMTFDHWPLIWKNFSQRGYVTYYSEDYPRWHLFNHWSLQGFRQKPVDHYARPFYLKIINHKLKRGFCFENEPMLSKGLKYLKEFMVKYGSNRPKFALHWIVDAAHKNPKSLSAHDGVLADFLQSLKPELENTFLFVLADHGHRSAGIRRTLIGKIEERMPFFSVTLPRNLPDREKILQVMDKNSKVITSHYDLYITLCDILLSAEDGQAQAFADENLWRTIRPRGLSLFRPIPPRDCETAGILEYHCICQQPMAVNITNPRVVLGAAKIVDHMNALMNRSTDKCAHLTLRQILYASVAHPNVKIDQFASKKSRKTASLHFLLTVAVVVDPSGGMFEGTLKYLKDSEYYLKQLAVTGNVERINLYGNQSHCIDSGILKLYCYCL